MPPPFHCDVAIIGGGLGGLALAAGLQERGFDVQLYEAAAELRTATSTLIGLGDNAFTALRSISPQIMERLPQEGAVGRKITRLVIPHKGATPEVSDQEPTSTIMTFRWSKVQNVLASIVDPAHVHCSYRAMSYTELPESEGGGVLVHFKNQPDVRARFVVAADGLKSPLRATMLPQDPGPRYLGHMNWNALIHNPGGKEKVDAHEPNQLKVVTDVPMGLFGVSCYVIDAGGGYTFWQVRIRSEQPSFTGMPAPSQPSPANDLAPVSSQQSPQQGGAAAWDLSAQQQQGKDAQQQDMPFLVGGGLGAPGSKARVLEILDRAGYGDVSRVVEATPETSIFERAILDRIPIDELPPWGDDAERSWSFQEDERSPLASPGNRVVLLGDALHAVHPGPGQGARSAFEDAHQLSELLQAHRPLLHGWKSTGTPPGAEPASNGSAAGAPAPDGRAPDADGVRRVVADYTKVRLMRVCRMQRFASEGCGLPAIREHSRKMNIARCPDSPTPSTPEEIRRRWQEFSSWFNSYPEKPNGDPSTTYWKPPPGLQA